VQALRRLRFADAMPEEELHYERGKARRRLFSCALTLLLAVLLVALLTFLEGPAQQIADHRAAQAADEAPAWAPGQVQLVRIWGWTWLVFLVVLMIVVLLAAVDLWATRRFALRQYRKIAQDRRAMIERQANRLRQERNGLG
jgi:hypothetical protein